MIFAWTIQDPNYVVLDDFDDSSGDWRDALHAAIADAKAANFPRPVTVRCPSTYQLDGQYRINQDGPDVYLDGMGTGEFICPLTPVETIDPGGESDQKRTFIFSDPLSALPEDQMHNWTFARLRFDANLDDGQGNVPPSTGFSKFGYTIGVNNSNIGWGVDNLTIKYCYFHDSGDSQHGGMGGGEDYWHFSPSMFGDWNDLNVIGNTFDDPYIQPCAVAVRPDTTNNLPFTLDGFQYVGNVCPNGCWSINLSLSPQKDIGPLGCVIKNATIAHNRTTNPYRWDIKVGVDGVATSNNKCVLENIAIYANTCTWNAAGNTVSSNLVKPFIDFSWGQTSDSATTNVRVVDNTMTSTGHTGNVRGIVANYSGVLDASVHEPEAYIGSNDLQTVSYSDTRRGNLTYGKPVAGVVYYPDPFIGQTLGSPKNEGLLIDTQITSELDLLPPWTIMFEVFYNGATSGLPTVIMKQEDSTNPPNRPYWIFFQGDALKLRTDSQTGNNQRELIFDFPQRQWHKVAVVATNTGTVATYLDDALAAPPPALTPANLASSDSSTYIHNNNLTNPANLLEGGLRWLKVFDTELTLQEMQQIGNYRSEIAPVADYNFTQWATLPTSDAWGNAKTNQVIAVSELVAGQGQVSATAVSDVPDLPGVEP